MKNYNEFLNENRIDKSKLKNKLTIIGPINDKIPECKFIINASKSSEDDVLNAIKEFGKYVEIDPAGNYSGNYTESNKEYLYSLVFWKVEIKHYTLEEYGPKNHKNILINIEWTIDTPDITLDEFLKLGLDGSIEYVKMKKDIKKYNI